MMVILETSRLILRKFCESDFPALCRLYGDADIRQYFPEGTLTEEQTRAELDWYLNGGWPEYPELGLRATIHRETNRPIGRCGLIPWTIGGKTEIELAYLIDKPFWRMGLGTEIVQAIAQYGREELNLRRIIALIDRNNVASIQTARRVGFEFEREVVVEGAQVLLYVLSF